MTDLVMLISLLITLIIITVSNSTRNRIQGFGVTEVSLETEELFTKNEIKGRSAPKRIKTRIFILYNMEIDSRFLISELLSELSQYEDTTEFIETYPEIMEYIFYQDDSKKIILPSY